MDGSEFLLEIEGIAIQVRQSAGRKSSIQVKVSPDGKVVATFPKSFSESEIKAFLQKKKKWIVQHVQETKDSMPKLPKGFIPLIDGSLFPFKGNEYALQIVSSEHFSVDLVGNKIIVSLPPKTKYEIKEMLIRELLTAWYHGEALEFFKRRVLHFSKLMKVFPKEVSLKTAKSFWGRCHANGNIELNWKLISASEDVIDYVIAHELAHLKYPNHSKQFHSFVDQFCDSKIKNHLKDCHLDF